MILSKKEKNILILAAALVLTIALTVCLIQCGSGKSRIDDTNENVNNNIDINVIDTEDITDDSPVILNELSASDTNDTSDTNETAKNTSANFELRLDYMDTLVNDGEMYYTLKNVTVVQKLNDANISPDDLDTEASVACNVGTEQQMNLINPLNANPRLSDKAFLFDKETGELADNCYLLIFEIDVTNNSMKNKYNSWSQENIFTLNTLPGIIVKRNDGIFDPCYEIGYFNESGQCAVDQYPCFELNIGETKSFVIGYFVYDASENPLSQLGFFYKWEYPFNQNNVIYWFDLSELAP